MNATLVHTSSRREDTMLAFARVRAAARLRDERMAREAKAAQVRATRQRLAEVYVSEAFMAGAVRMGFKVCFEEGGKWRDSFPIEDAAARLASVLVEPDVEAWGVDAQGEYVWSMM